MRNVIPHFIHAQYQAGQQQGRFAAASLFVDMSGFMPLTETLMRRRKEGAEDLTDVLNRIFQPIVQQVYAHGGMIAVFAGDAFTALFPAANDNLDLPARRAAQTAFFIRQFFQQHGTIETRYGRFELGARIGLGRGQVQWGILGRGGLQAYFFRGLAIDTCVHAEDHAQSGEIVAAPELLPLLEGSVQGEPAGTCFRLTELVCDCPPETLELPALTPEILRRFILDEVIGLTAPAEFRDVASVFISFQAPPRLPTLDRFIGSVLEEALNYGGYFNKLDFGDKGPVILVLFGAPVAHEDDVTRAAEFLLALRRHQTGVRWKAGITFGTVYAGFIGGEERCEYTAIGDVVNLASRLMSRAAPETIWTGPRGARLLAARGYKVESIGRLALKGKQDTVAVSRLIGRSGLVEATAYRGPFVGREAELDQLSRWLRPIMSGRFAGIIYVYGEAGIGKSRLVEERYCRLNRRAHLSQFICPADGTLRQPLNPFKHFMARYFDQSREADAAQNRARVNAVLDGLLAGLSSAEKAPLRAELERLRPFFGAWVGLPWEDPTYEHLEPQLRFDNMLAAFKTLVKAESLRRPVVVHVEDGHWLDGDSQRLLQALTRNVAAYPFAIVVTCRYGDDGSAFKLALDADVAQHALDLHPFSSKYIQAMAVESLGGAIASDLTKFLVEKANGNPFFVEQLLLDLNERGVLQRDEHGHWTVPQQAMSEVPTSVNAVLVARLDRLEARVRSVVQTAAVLGQEFEIQILSMMLRDDANLLPKVEQAERAAIWEALSDLHYLFKHALLRDAAYNMQLRARLRALHQLAAQSIEEVYAADLAMHAAELAYHYGQAGDATREGYYAPLAGEQAFQVSAYREALGFFERALALQESAGLDYVSLSIQVAKTLIPLGEYARAEQSLTEGIALARTSGDDANCAAALVHLGTVARRRGDFEQARAWLEESLVLARQIGDTAQTARALYHLGWVAIRQGDYDEARNHLAESQMLWRALGDRSGFARSLVGLGGVALAAEEYGEAARHFSESLTLCREVGDRGGMAVNLNNLGETAQQRGDIATARHYYEGALEILREVGDPANVAGALCNLGHVAAALGDQEGARSFYLQALELTLTLGAMPRVLDSVAGIAQVLAHSGQPEQSLTLLAAVIRHPSLMDETNHHVVEPTLERLRELLSPDAVRAGLARGKAEAVGEVAAALLAGAAD